MEVAIFDDQPGEIAPIRDIVDKSLSPDKIEIISTISAARRLCREDKLSTYDAFFVDLYFDGLASGLGLIETLRKSYPFTPIFALSDTRDSNDGDSAKARGANSFEFKRNIVADYAPHLKQLISDADAAVNKVSIIHISDIHATAAIDPDTLSNVLTTDAKRVLRQRHLPKANFLVCSGDIANSGVKEEYAIAERFIEKTIADLCLDRSDIVLIPGNHDVNWQEQWYDLYSAARLPKNMKDKAEEYGNVFICSRDGKYTKRFDDYMSFSRRYNAPGLVAREKDHGWCITSASKHVQFYCFNSASLIDEFHPKRIRIPTQAITACIENANTAVEASLLPHMLRVAVVHHPPAGVERLDNPEFLGRLVDQGVKFLLHGHIHELNRESVFGATQGRNFNVVGSGSLAVGKAHRSEGVPILYHVIEIERRRRKVFVHTRCQLKNDGRFDPYSVWATDNPLENLAYYECSY